MIEDIEIDDEDIENEVEVTIKIPRGLYIWLRRWGIDIDQVVIEALRSELISTIFETYSKIANGELSFIDLFCKLW
ncbi:MAG: hypothetical protein Q6363_008395 [Candidatus Njordarchaeota archaeon]